mmetsp:Transcript_20373/g.81456  ORF Transcript_20373/g.81456 Transcript_20373/m.81456 type:complete len:261 (-) Transcript_20373:197-979(-)
MGGGRARPGGSARCVRARVSARAPRQVDRATALLATRHARRVRRNALAAGLRRVVLRRCWRRASADGHWGDPVRGGEPRCCGRCVRRRTTQRFGRRQSNETSCCCCREPRRSGGCAARRGARLPRRRAAAPAETLSGRVARRVRHRTSRALRRLPPRELAASARGVCRSASRGRFREWPRVCLSHPPIGLDLGRRRAARRQQSRRDGLRGVGRRATQGVARDLVARAVRRRAAVWTAARGSVVLATLGGLRRSSDRRCRS